MKCQASFVRLLAVTLLLTPPWLCSQETHQKKASATPPEEKTAESHSGAGIDRPCEVTTCPTKVLQFSNLSQPTELQDFTNTMRTIVEISRIQQIPAEQMVIVQGTPEQIAMAEKLADEIDKAKRRFGEIGYRIDLRINESRGDRKLPARNYSLVTEAGQPSRLSMGRPAPAPSQGEAATTKSTLDAAAGGSIEYRIGSVGERTVELSIDLALPASEPGAEGKSAPASEASPQLRVKDHVTLELGRSTVISMVDDPNDGHSFQIEVMVTRIKGTS